MIETRESSCKLDPAVVFYIIKKLQPSFICTVFANSSLPETSEQTGQPTRWRTGSRHLLLQEEDG